MLGEILYKQNVLNLLKGILIHKKVENIAPDLKTEYD